MNDLNPKKSWMVLNRTIDHKKDDLQIARITYNSSNVYKSRPDSKPMK